MNIKRFLRKRGFIKKGKDVYVRENGGNHEYLDLDNGRVYVHDEDGRFTSVPQDLFKIKDWVQLMKDENQLRLGRWIDGLDDIKETQTCLSDYNERR